MYTIMAILWDAAGGQLTSSEALLYSPETQDTRPVVRAVGSLELSEGGSLETILAYGHPLYDTLKPLETYISVTDDEEEIFYGRIFGKSDPTFTGQITYKAEGALSFLHDSEVTPDSSKSGRNMTVEAFFRWCIDQHNADIQDPRRQFTVGQVTASRRNETRNFRISSYTETRSAIDQNVTGMYGGYLRIRKNPNGGHYIDWIQEYDRLDPQAIEIGVNVISLTNALSGEEIFTVLRPIGANGRLLSPPTIDLFPAAQMAKMGRIIKSVNFNDADTDDKLRQKATDYAARIEKVILAETSIRLVDMHYLDGTVPKIRIGDRFDNIYGTNGTVFTVGHMDIDFMRPENDTFSFKNKKDLEGNTGVSSGGISRSASRGAAGGALLYKYYHEAMDQATLNAHDISVNATNLEMISRRVNVISEDLDVATNNLEILSYTVPIVTDGLWPAWETGKAYAKGDKVSKEVDGKIRGFICQTAHTSGDWDADAANWQIQPTTTQMAGDIRTIQGTDVIQNSSQIAEVAGSFQVLTDYYDDWPIWEAGKEYNAGDRVSWLVEGKRWGYICQTDHTSAATWAADRNYWVEQSGRKSLRLLDGAALEIDDLNGQMTTVGARLDVLAGGIENLNTQTNTMLGSALWTQRNQITGVSGEFRVDTDPNTGTKTLVILSGGGMKIRENGQEFGLYHKGELTGGLIVGQLNARTFAPWVSRAEYPVGAKVSYNGIGYKCITAHRSGDTFDSSKWEIYSTASEDGQTLTKIVGDVVNVEARQVKVGSTSNVESWMNTTDIWKNDTDETLDDYEGLIADRATIAQLNAAKARISNIEADYIATGNLAANIANITDQLSAWNARFNSASARDLIILGADSQGHETRSSVKTFLKQVQVVPTATAGEYVLQYKTYNDTDWQDAGTFRKAASINNLTGSWSGATLTVETSPSTGKTYTVVLGTSASLGGDQNISMLTNGAPTQNAVNQKYLDVPMKLVTITSGTPPVMTTRYEETITVDGTAVWSAGEASGLVTGWANAYNKVVLPGQNTSSASATLKTPGATSTSNPVQNTNTFTLGNDGNNAVVLSYTMNSGTPITVARYEHNKYSAGETNGWVNAYNKVVLPGQNTSSASATLKTPGATPTSNPVQNTNTFTLGNDGNNAVVLSYTMNSGTPITVARYEHNKYSAGETAGKNAVTISKSYDNSQSRVVFSKSAGTASTKAVKIGVKDSGSGLGWSGNTYTYRICDYEDNTQGVNLETNARTVDATARYNAGVTAGKNAVTLTDSGWSSGKVTFGKSEGTASTKTVQLTASSASWSGNSATVQIWDGTAADTQHGRNTGYTVTVNASGRYNAGVTAGKNAVTINKGSWSGGQISFTKSEGTASTKTVQLSAANPSWSGNTATVKIWDGTAADSQHGVDTGYTVSVNASGIYTNGYNAGYTAGQGSMGVAVSAWGKEGDDETITLSASSNPNGSSVKYSFRTSGTYWRDYNANIGYRGIAVWRSLGGSAYEYDHGFEVEVDATSRYNAGQNSVTITKSYDNSQSRVSFSKSAGTASTKAVKIGVKDSGSGLGWSGNTYTYRICDYEDNTQGVNLEANARTVDATARYNAGYTAGQGSMGVAVSAWGKEGDDETITLSASSNPNGSSVKYSFRMSDTYWRSYNANIGYRGIAVWRSLGGSAYEYDHGFEVEVDATSRYNAGQNSVTISKTYDRANSRVSFSKSAGSADNKAVKIGIKDSGETGLGWNGTTYKYRICDYEDNQQGVNIENNPRTITHGIKIDGWGTESGNDTLGLSLSTNPNASSVKYSFRMSDTYWRSYNANIGYRGIAVWRSLGGGAYEYDHGFEVEVDATSRYNQGYADGGGGVTDSDFAGFNSITSYGSGDGYDTGGKLYVAGISKGSIKAPGYLAFRISCKGHTRYCYITINT